MMPVPEIKQACKHVTARTVCLGPEKSVYKVAKRVPKIREKKNEMPKRMLVTSDLIRKIRVPYQRDPMTVSLEPQTYEGLVNSSKVVTKEELEAAARARQEEKDRLAAESLARRQALEAADMVREMCAAQAVDELQEEARQRAANINDRARIAKMEADEDIKQMNQMIMQAKIYAVRDAQVAEKKIIQKEMEREDRRLDDMMEQERRRELAEQQRREEERRIIREKQKAVIIEQIADNEERRILSAEKKNQEAELIRKQIHKMQLEDMQADEEKKRAQRALIESLHVANQELQDRREHEEEVARLQDEQIREYQRKKAEQEEAFEQEQLAIKRAKEVEIAKISAQQAREQDRLANEQERRARRERERAEREWRRRELDDAKRKAQTEADLKASRTEQINQKHHLVAVMAQRDRADFYRILQAQQAAEDASKSEAAERQRRSQAHLVLLKKQICELEQRRVNDRRKVFEEGMHTRILQAQREQELLEHKKGKLEELKRFKVPQKYLNDVARRAHVGVDQLASPPPDLPC